METLLAEIEIMAREREAGGSDGKGNGHGHGAQGDTTKATDGSGRKEIPVLKV